MPGPGGGGGGGFAGGSLIENSFISNSLTEKFSVFEICDTVCSSVFSTFGNLLSNLFLPINSLLPDNDFGDVVSTFLSWLNLGNTNIATLIFGSSIILVLLWAIARFFFRS